MWRRVGCAVIQSESSHHRASTVVMSRRALNLQEYQSKQLLDESNVRIQRFFVADSKAEVEKKLEDFTADELVVKAQILAGGRGKGTFSNGFKGGVHISRDRKKIVECAAQMFGQRLVTKQTAKDGALVNTVMVCESVDLTRETYLAILLDRNTQSPVIVASPAGGMDIEEVAENTPELIHKEVINVDVGLTHEQATKLATALEFEGELVDDAATQIKRLYQLFVKVDATQVEINPFSETGCGSVYCVDAKLNFDDCAEFRQERVFAMDDKSEHDARELMATQHNLNYIPLDGDIACLVNGAGLAMATMDVIKSHGGEAANFLDVGGRVDEAAVLKAFEIIIGDGKVVKAILVNIFGGIVNCELIAKGIVSAFKKMHISVPLVVRLEGTAAIGAREILASSGLPIITAGDLDDAAEKAVASIAA